MKRLALIPLLALLSAPVTKAADPPCGVVYVIQPAPPGAEPVAPLTLYLPNSWPRDIRVESLGRTSPVEWRGLACDKVALPAGSTLRAVSEGANPNWLYTLRPDGYLDFKYDPVEK